MATLEGKNILFISPEFFGIDKVIMRILREKGASVEWMNERSVTGSFARAMNSVNPAIFHKQSNRYYKRKIAQYSQMFDIIFVIKGDMITKETISLFREKYPNAQIVLYLYDPVVYIKGITKTMHLYDRVISFEPKDCKEYGFEFRPLFCDIASEDREIDEAESEMFDVCFYGTMYGDRFDIVHQIKQLSDKQGFRFYSFCFLRGKFMAVYYWLRNKAFRKMGLKSVSYTPKTTKEIATIIRNSKIIMDANDVLQEGLTLRTIETMVSGKRMITTNKAILDYDFYNPNNICVVDRKNIVIPQEFLDGAYEKVPAEILERYTAEGWVNDVFLR